MSTLSELKNKLTIQCAVANSALPELKNEIFTLNIAAMLVSSSQSNLRYHIFEEFYKRLYAYVCVLETSMYDPESPNTIFLENTERDYLQYREYQDEQESSQSDASIESHAERSDITGASNVQDSDITPWGVYMRDFETRQTFELEERKATSISVFNDAIQLIAEHEYDSSAANYRREKESEFDAAFNTYVVATAHNLCCEREELVCQYFYEMYHKKCEVTLERVDKVDPPIIEFPHMSRRSRKSPPPFVRI
jgi:hypothetical protein